MRQSVRVVGQSGENDTVQIVFPINPTCILEQTEIDQLRLILRDSNGVEDIDTAVLDDKYIWTCRMRPGVLLDTIAIQNTLTQHGYTPAH